MKSSLFCQEKKKEEMSETKNFINGICIETIEISSIPGCTNNSYKKFIEKGNLVQIKKLNDSTLIKIFIKDKNVIDENIYISKLSAFIEIKNNLIWNLLIGIKNNEDRFNAIGQSDFLENITANQKIHVRIAEGATLLGTICFIGSVKEMGNGYFLGIKFVSFFFNFI